MRSILAFILDPSRIGFFPLAAQPGEGHKVVHRDTLIHNRKPAPHLDWPKGSICLFRP